MSLKEDLLGKYDPNDPVRSQRVAEAALELAVVALRAMQDMTEDLWASMEEEPVVVQGIDR